MLASTSGPYVHFNVLSILERLGTFPTEASELNAWWVNELGTKPRQKTGNEASEDVEEDEKPHTAEAADEEDDWRKFFDDEPRDTGTKQKTGVVGRIHTLTLHQSLHSLGSHRAVFTRAWLALLPRLFIDPSEQRLGRGGKKKANALVVRALNVMHRGVLPHLTRPVLVMDWIGECVDLGKYSS